MSASATVKTLAKMVKEIKYHQWLYYCLNENEINDRVFDAMLADLKRAESKVHPILIFEESPTLTPGSDMEESYSYWLEEFKERRKQYKLKRGMV